MCSLHIDGVTYTANNLYFIVFDEIDTVWKLACGAAMFQILLQRLDTVGRKSPLCVKSFNCMLSPVPCYIDLCC